MELSVRLATIDDAELLLSWRNDPATRAASHNTGEVSLHDHLAWLTLVLVDPSRKLYIAEADGIPIGTVRADAENGITELSWTVAPSARRKGYGRKMVSVVAKRIDGPIRAEVKVGNATSVRIAFAVGMDFDREEAGVLHYSRR